MTLQNEIQDEQITLSSKSQGGQDSFKGLLRAGSGNAKRGVILMHGRNAHPDAVVVGLLRKSLQSLGYTTFSIENPIPKAGDEFPNYVADIKEGNYVFPEAASRVRSALNYLKDRSVKDIVLLGFSMGARLQASYLALNEATALPISGLIALSGGTNGVGPLNIATSFQRIRGPVLDICGQGDTDVASTSEARKMAYLSGGDKNFSQEILQGAVPHNFAGHEAALKEKVHAWITSVAPA